ncbi:MAG TPA: universal stress protein, partial [Thermoleophilaceae bacterium]|nr:universal stress protein [Thermoleophilaceae bacterium]
TAIAIPLLWYYRDSLVPARPAAPVAPKRASMVVALGGRCAEQVSAMTVPLARARGSEVHVLHVIETDVVAGEAAVELETRSDAQQALDRSVATLSQAGVLVTGELLESIGGHADVAKAILSRSAELSAGLIVLGAESSGALAGQVTAEIAASAPTHVVVINPAAGALGSPVPGIEARENVWR